MLNMKKAIAAVGALAMSAGLLAGCGSGSGGSDEGVGTKDSPVDLAAYRCPVEVDLRRLPEEVPEYQDQLVAYF